MSNPARFLSRWSRLKRQAVAEVPSAPEVAQPLSPEGLPAVPEGVGLASGAPFAPGTDLTALLREELTEAVRKQALKAIFADPHFNVMDGLDTYIDDYSISEPIPPEMLATLNQARFLFESSDAQALEPPVDLPVPDGQAAVDCDNLEVLGQEVPVASVMKPEQ